MTSPRHRSACPLRLSLFPSHLSPRYYQMHLFSSLLGPSSDPLVNLGRRVWIRGHREASACRVLGLRCHPFIYRGRSCFATFCVSVVSFSLKTAQSLLQPMICHCKYGWVCLEGGFFPSFRILPLIATPDPAQKSRGERPRSASIFYNALSFRDGRSQQAHIPSWGQKPRRPRRRWKVSISSKEYMDAPRLLRGTNSNRRRSSFISVLLSMAATPLRDARPPSRNLFDDICESCHWVYAASMLSESYCFLVLA